MSQWQELFTIFSRKLTVLDVFGIWIFILTMILWLTPLEAVALWRKRDSSDGFPAHGLLFGVCITILWLCYGVVKPDYDLVCVNAIGLVLNACYLLCYDYYLDEKKTFHIQLAITTCLVASVLFYNFDLPQEEMVKAFGRVCSAAQIIGLFVGIYGIYIAWKIKSTEYMPFKMTSFGFFFSINILIWSFLVGDFYMQIANIWGSIVSFCCLCVYFIYPPTTWRLPWDRRPMEKTKRT